MTHENDNDFHKLTLSQREGLSPLPEAMQLEHIPRIFKQIVWRIIDTEIGRSASHYYDYNSYSYWSDEFETKNIGSIIETYKFDIEGIYHDEIQECDPSTAASFLKERIEGGAWHEVLTLIEFILRHKYCSKTCTTV